MPEAAGQDWTVQAADTVERVVGSVRNKTTTPLVIVARAMVFGLLAAIVGGAAAVFLVVGLVRLVDVYTGEGRVWIAYALLGGIFTLAGLFLLRRATAIRKG
ncbi:MAG TPA: hypothetical protein VM938_13095 [Acidimicrobiales bacterium]|nr:hypothetical protein [Acidimicrobiales bacterium]